ncbi:MAG: Glu-tRNA(Gln) amidotransferase subunit GatE [Thaumarchaeota archaeon]|nr:Glu-tRNA(Gln) amidotransferase subunit GatE [Nitrososphaerota archaeon]
MKPPIPTDFATIGLKVGLEVHQQLATPTKLFCACPPYTGEEIETNLNESPELKRVLRPASSELGEIDEAARFESRREIRVRYLAPIAGSCLVDADEEPPRPISNEALETSLIFALSLKSRIIDEIHVMRKIVVDGSNTSGFQRTAAIALGGILSYGNGKSVGVQSISLEEDAARAAKDEGSTDFGERTYVLDRLGTPLVEVALAPIDGTPEDAEIAAKTLGRLMRSTGRVARGLGTIRQDLNISVMGGRVIEVKGVQRLDQFRKVVMYEALRQKFFFDLANEIKEKVGVKLDITQVDVTQIFEHTSSGILKKALSSDSASVNCIVVRRFAGFIGKENELHSRLGKELGSIARSYGLGGVFHSDELPNYGITQTEIDSLRSKEKILLGDAFILIAGPGQKVDRVVNALISRLQESAVGVPAETRAATLDGETSFLRPRPGAARMYPETDIPLIQISPNILDRLSREVPVPWEEQVDQFSRKYEIPKQLAEPMLDSERKDLFEQIMSKMRLSPGFVASSLTELLVSLSRGGLSVSSLADEDLFALFQALDQGRFAKEAFPEVLRQYLSNPGIPIDQVLLKSGLNKISDEDLEKIVDAIISQNEDLIRSKGSSGAERTLMGKVMQLVRGKADGKLVNETLSRRLLEFQKEKVNQGNC